MTSLLCCNYGKTKNYYPLFIWPLSVRNHTHQRFSYVPLHIVGRYYRNYGWSEPVEQPHQLNIALCLPLQASARMDTVKVAVDRQLEQYRWMICRSTCIGRLSAIESKCFKIERVDKYIDDPHSIVFVDVFVKLSWKENALGAVYSFNEAFNRDLPQ